MIDSNKKLKKFYSQKFLEIRNSTEFESKHTSKYFGEIGSIPIQDIPYNKQLEIKQTALKQIFPKFNKEIEIAGSEVTEHYRLKMEYVCSYDPFHEPNSRFGQRKTKRFNWVVDMDEAVLADKKWFTKTRKIYDFLQENSFRNYDLVKKDGNLRYIVLKSFKNEAMLNIVTKYEDSENLIDQAAEIATNLGFKSIYWSINPDERDEAVGLIKKVYGDKLIDVEMGSKSFKIGPYTFFQNNISGFENLVTYVKKFIEENKQMTIESTLYDLYCGVGTLGIIFSNYFKNVVGFEIVEDSVKLGEMNIKLNKIDNYKISTRNLNSVDDDDSYPPFELNQFVIVDPPRAGLQKHGISHINKLSPKFLIYISCNPITQAMDLENLKGYKVIEAKAFDLFPHTLHMENVIILERG